MAKRIVYQNHPYVKWTHSQGNCVVGSVRGNLHYDHSLILTYLAHGKGHLQVEGCDHQLCSGDILILNLSELHCCHFDESPDHERISMYISPAFSASVSASANILYSAYYDRKPGSQNVIPAELVQELRIDHLLTEIVTTPQEDEDEYNILLSCLTAQVLLLLKKAIITTPADTKNTVRSELVTKVIQYINDHLSEELSAADIAEKFFVDKSYFCRVFRKFTGMTSGQYITRKRIDNAIGLLNQGVSCTDACFASGFGNYSSFYKAFKTFTGTEPNDFRN